jgi:uncharacterized lipoprotein YajG
MLRTLFLLSCLLLLASCNTDQMSRNVYEGVRARDQSREGTLQEGSKDRLPVYDQYEKERRR